MRKPLIAGNWKMNLLRDSGIALVKQLIEKMPASGHAEVAVCPPAIYLSDIAKALSGSSIALGSQNLYQEEEGAFTGEISAKMVKDIGCRYAILGHSERRQLFGETDASVNKKMFAALKHGLIPIVCVGETLQQREAGETQKVVQSQVRGSLAGLTPEQAGDLVIAYEPVWAIGTGRTASPGQAEEVHADIRRLLGEIFGAASALKTRIQYGGSVKPDNAKELLGQPNIDGALVGGASLKADQFLPIIEAAG